MPPLGGAYTRFTGLTGQLLGQALGYGTGSAMAAALTPVVQPLANFAWDKLPALPVPASIAAAVALKRPDLAQAMAHEARIQGFDDRAFSAFIDSADAPPGLAELLELWRRRAISDGEFTAGLYDALIPARWHGPLSELRRVLLSPADLAMMRQQSFIDAAEQHRRSALQGVDAEDAELLFEISGEPYGPETAIQLWRRGLIDQARVAEVIREGRTKLKYIPDILKLKDVPLSPAVYAEAVLKAQIPHSEGVSGAALSGISAPDFEILARVNGRPVAIGEALTLVRRGERDAKWFTEVVARSDVRPEYADDLLLLKRVLPTPMELRRMLQNGSVTDEYGKQVMLWRGYDEIVADGVVKAAHADAAAGTKDLAAAQVVALYEAGFEDRAWALDALQSLNYSPENADLVLTVSEARRLIGYLNAVIARVKAKYVAHQIELDEALALLEAAGIAADQRQQYTDLWAAEREANVRRLTQAQVAKMLKLGLIGDAEALQRFEGMGYPPEDAQALVLLVHHPESTIPSPVG